MGLQLGSRNLPFMTFSTQLQDPTKLFSHIFHLFHLFLELQNLVVFKKVIYKITNVFKFCRECIWSSQRVAKLTIFSSKRITLFLVWTGFKTITLHSLIKSNYFYHNGVLNQSEDAEHVTLQYIVDCFWADFQWGRETKNACFGEKRCWRAWKTNFTPSLAVIHLSFIIGVLCFSSGAAIHVQTLVISAHFTVILVAMVNLAMMAELYHTSEISDISIWQYKNMC